MKTDFVMDFIRTYWRGFYLVYSVGACFLVIRLVPRWYKTYNAAQRAAATWGGIGFALVPFYLLGAADGPLQFLVLFSFGATGAAFGYLTGVWLAPSSLSEQSRLMKAGSLVATLAAGAVGTKLLSISDDVIKDKRIFQPAYFLPVVTAAAGYLVALAAFYAIRSAQDGQVRITAPAAQFVPWKDDKGNKHENGVAAGTKVQFSGASDFNDDMSVLWTMTPKGNPPGAPALPPGAGISADGLLTAPDATWMKDNRDFLDWVVEATSNLDRSKSASYEVHFVLNTRA